MVLLAFSGRTSSSEDKHFTEKKVFPCCSFSEIIIKRFSRSQCPRLKRTCQSYLQHSFKHQYLVYASIDFYTDKEFISLHILQNFVTDRIIKVTCSSVTTAMAPEVITCMSVKNLALPLCKTEVQILFYSCSNSSSDLSGCTYK